MLQAEFLEQDLNVRALADSSFVNSYQELHPMEISTHSSGIERALTRIWIVGCNIYGLLSPEMPKGLILDIRRDLKGPECCV